MNAGSRLPRLVRGTTAAAVATYVALLGHVAAGGEVPRMLGVAAPLVLSILICTLLSAARQSLPRLIGSVVVAQSLFHLLFVLGAAPAADVTEARSSAGSAVLLSSAHEHRDSAFVALSGSAHQHVTAPMLLGHAAAAAVTVAALFFAERLLSSLLGLALRLALRLLPEAPAAVSLRPFLSLRGRFFTSSFARAPLLSAASRRGPPLSAR